MSARFYGLAFLCVFGVLACDRKQSEVPSMPVMSREQALALASRSDCLICHRIEIKRVGPAWRDVAAKYRGESDAVSRIASHIKSGGSFGWKLGTMPPRGGGSITDAEIVEMARFIAALE